MSNKNCCTSNSKSNIKQGIIYGILPHSFCIAFIILSVIGATTATVLLQSWLLNPYFFPFLIILSFLLATASAFLYLKKLDLLSFEGIQEKKKYLLTLYTTIVGVNILFFLVIFPLTANLSLSSNVSTSNQNNLSLTTLEVKIPCSGHAPLISGELKKLSGVNNVKFRFPNYFDIAYDSRKISLEEILSLQVFTSFEAKQI